MAKQLSIIEHEGPEGFEYFPDILSSQEEKKLVTFLKSLDWQHVKMHGVIAKRKVVHFGLDYAYDSRELSPTMEAPKEIQFLIKRAAPYLHVEPDEIKEVLVSYYPVGSQIGWHRDSPQFQSVFGYSLQGHCTFKLRKDDEKYNLEMEPRSGYMISGKARWNWQHHIPAVKEERYSITLRTLNEKDQI